MTNKVIWCDRGWMPYYYGFCPNEKAWRSEMKRLGVTAQVYPTEDAQVTHFAEKNDCNACSIVTVAHIKRSSRSVVGLLIHESMHIWRQMREHIGEKEPSSEFEAYQIQSIAVNLISAYEETRGKLLRA